jgi:SNF2 family DNA or RNA helicase
MQRQQRVTAIERFHSDSETRVFLISLKSGGMGLNLVAANNVLLTDLWWNAAAEDQVWSDLRFDDTCVRVCVLF